MSGNGSRPRRRGLGRHAGARRRAAAGSATPGCSSRRVWRTIRGEDDRGRKVRWLFGLLRPYRVRVFWMMVALVLATAAALAPPYLAGLAIDKGIGTDPPASSDLNALTLIVLAFLASAVIFWAGDLRADLPRRLGRSARAPGPARADLHPPAVDVARLLHPQPARRADLADDERRAGARHARHRRDRDHGLERADAGRRRRDPARDRRPARAGHVPDLPDPRDRQHRLPGRVGERLPADPGEDRQHHRLPAGEPERRPRRPQLRPGAAAPDRDVGPQRGEPRGQHADGLPERLLLPGGRAAVGGRNGGDPAVRRLSGDQRQHRDRRPLRVRRLPADVLRPDPADQPALHDLPAGDGGAGQDLRPARHRARPRRPPERDRPGRDPRARSTSRASGSATPRIPAASRTGR